MKRITATIPVALVALGLLAGPAGAATTHATTKHHTTRHHRRTDSAGDYEVVLGFRKTTTGANKLVTKASDKGLNATTEKGTKPLEIEISGFTTKADAKAAAAKARAAGFKGAFVEHS